MSSVYMVEGSKRPRHTIELYDSDDEFDEWFLESIPEKVGLCHRSMWMHPMNKRRPADGEFIRVCIPYQKYPTIFFQYFQMSASTFDYILESIKDDLIKYFNIDRRFHQQKDWR